MATWREEFETGPEGAEITTANTGLTTVFYGGSVGIISAPPIFSVTPAGDGLCAVLPIPPSPPSTGHRHAEFTYEADPAGYASCRVSVWLAAPRSTAYSSASLTSMLGHFEDLGFTAGIFTFFHHPTGGAALRFIAAGSGGTSVNVIPGANDSGWWEFGGDYTTASNTWTAYAKNPAGVTVWSESGDAGSVIRPVGLDALSRSDRLGVFVAVDNMEFVTPSSVPLRQYPRFDGLGMSPVRRGYPPNPAPRLIGGQP